MSGLARADVGGRVETERDDVGRVGGGGGTPYACTRVVGIDDGAAMRAQRRDRVRVLVRHVVDAAHEFLVLALRVGDDGDRRLCNRGELARFAAMVHADLEHRQPMRWRAARAPPAEGRSRC